MEKVQLDQLDMLYAVENHFDDNPTLWSANAPLTAAKNLLTQKIAAISAQHAQQLLNTEGVTDGKNTIRKNLELQAFTIGSALSGYANVVGNTDLYDRARYTKSQLETFRDAELVGICTNLAADTNAEITNLAPYGILPATLTAFNTLRTSFGAVMKNPSEAIARRKKATDKIAELLPDALLFLDERLDNLIVSLQSTQSDFVEMYGNVRLISSSPTNTRSLTTLCVDAEGSTPIANVVLTILSDNTKRKSPVSGFNVFQNLKAGKEQIRVEHVDYKTQIIDFTMVTGITTELAITMVRV
jgi:hypothetical protein